MKNGLVNLIGKMEAKTSTQISFAKSFVFLLSVGVRHKNEQILNYTKLTLHKMAMGGIYDQIGGGVFQDMQ